jgi:hypothetical protein
MRALPKLVFASLYSASVFLAGCQHNSIEQGRAQEDVPTQAKLDELKPVATGVNKQFYYKAPKYGELFLYDFNSGEFIFRGHLAAGEQFLFEPASSRATINKQTIDLDRGTNEQDEYRLFFVPQ